jgi:hypothetical protein
MSFNPIAWTLKPCLPKVYRSFHETIRRNLKSLPGKLVVELGSGIGSVSEKKLSDA